MVKLFCSYVMGITKMKAMQLQSKTMLFIHFFHTNYKTSATSVLKNTFVFIQSLYVHISMNFQCQDLKAA